MRAALLAVLLAVLLAFTLTACDSSDEVATATSTVTVAYQGRLEDGTVFDQSSGATFSLRNVIPGFRDGIVGMQVGDSKTLTIAPEDGYGANPPPGSGIPPNATLIFDVTLLAIR